MVDLHKLTLELSEPLEVQTNGLGRILVSHWSIGAAQKIADLLKKDIASANEFVGAFIQRLGRIPGNGQSLHEQFESGTPIDSTEKLTETDLGVFSKAYVETFRHQILSWITYSEDGKDSDDGKKKEGESNEDFFYRLIKTSVIKQQEQENKLVERLGLSGATGRLFQNYSKNQARIGELGAKIRDLSSPSIIEPKHHPNIPVIPDNPVHKTNELLADQASKLDVLSELLESQAEQAVLLNEQTELLLQDAARSSAQTKVGIWVAAGGIALGALLSCYSIYSSTVSEEQSSSLLQNNLDQNEQSIQVQKEALEKLEIIGRELDNVRRDGATQDSETKSILDGAIDAGSG